MPTRISVPTATCRNPNLQDLRGSGGDLCGQITNSRFGTARPDQLVRPDPTVRLRRPAVGLGAERVGAAAAHETGVDRRLLITAVRSAASRSMDNQVTKASDYTAYSITAPLDPRLPGGGGYMISGLYDIVPSLSGQINSLTTIGRKYGDWKEFQWRGHHPERARHRGLTFQGGTSTGHNAATRAMPIRATRAEHDHRRGSGRLNGQHGEPVLQGRLRLADADARPRRLTRSRGWTSR